ncbi:MAG TPA: NAD(P)-dependent oxidoreductase [Rudaea sp.]|jgi:3-hydroxyisobutyrate dehydrogenase|uniref:NAD(P)-dependent oxidoreductase n=1 Tax=Rudaea sp. TaxID=2136325 RepID=UPI002F91E1E5
MSDLRVGFIGLGAMGWAMAAHLKRVGLLAGVANRSPAKAQAFATEHGVVAATPAELAKMCNVVVLCVTADADVLAVTREIAANTKPGTVVIDHSTVSSATAKQAHALMQAAGSDFLDAPVSGGVEGAKNGKLSIMLGGDAATLARVKPMLEAYGARIGHMGGIGAGQDTKAVNQVLVAGIAQAVCEGLALGEALGLDPAVLLPTLASGAAANWFLDKRGATMLRNEFGGGFKAALLHKDLRIVREVAQNAGTDHSIVDKSIGDLAKLMEQGYGDEEHSALIRLKRRKN